MILYINTTVDDFIFIALKDGQGKIIEKKIKTNRNQAEKLIINIDKFLNKNKIKQTEIKAIIVADVGGAFTALRVGVITANALAYAWQIPVLAESLNPFYSKKNDLGQEKKINKTSFDFKIVEPKYSAEPNILLPKKKK